MVFQQKLLEKAYFIFKLTGQAMIQPASSDKWIVPPVIINWMKQKLHKRIH